MAPLITEHEKSWPAAEMPAGTFDWQKAVFRAAIPEDAKEVKLVVGLEAVSGKTWFDDIRVAVWKPLAGRESIARPPAMYKGHEEPRLRGTMISPGIDDEGLRLLGQRVERQPHPLATRPHREIRRPARPGRLRPLAGSSPETVGCRAAGVREVRATGGGRPALAARRQPASAAATLAEPRAVHRRRLPAEVRRAVAAHRRAV